ncbi:centrosomal protein POC5 isoform X1 [Canis lupus baileyi]|uniref:Centrosomal protein POC5 n=2 Tax=Canis lupus familiaris TaxID=9615 RepID=A0A8C0PT59_CANLF|nr:centrosomal protein POC5 isoform X1 [Canis lupus familiaris]XP_022272485.1 centrosomal protein POC5 isoform X1 [Canis lupus familiaris]XP_038516939.1 centrosomal protein POC5 isoform X1 [Canis lupus familiaris]XP_038516940.1 centrosomal protein POC5 isoform X1 [Canis lupus familiaris]|eukprot:XP_022272484.1 centrosomal protein POC5 isoform X1 [Canis lupus familiaris]
MSSDEEKCSLPVMQKDSDQHSSVSSDLQEEYEELLRYAIVTPNVESDASQPCHSKGEVVPDVRVPTVIDDILHNQAGNSPVVRETRMEVGKGCDLNISSHSKTDGSSPVSSPRKPSHPVMDFFSSNLLGDSSSPGSISSHADVHEIVVSDFLISDENLQKMENVLDLWSSGLKTNIISELSKWRLNFIDWHRMEMKKEKEKHAAHLKQLCNQINSLKELQKAYEVSIGRKDEVISSLSHAIGKQKERIELMRTFFHWRIGHVKSRQDVYEGKLADQYFQRTLLKKVWKGWRSIVQKQWKDVVERACQARAEEVCVQLSNDYETRVAVLSGALENAKAEIQRMQHEKEHFEDSMKKAFMRGVCALNLEAMTIFQNRGDTGIDFTNNKKEEYGPGIQGKEHSAHLDPLAPPMPSVVAQPPSPPPAAMGAASAAAFPSAASISSAGPASASSTHPPVSAALGAGPTATAAPEEMYVPRVVTSAQQKAGRTITARITGRCDFASKNRISSGLAIMGVSPPMSSVVVEKHHPVTVQTIPQAAAAKYPRTIHPESSTSASRSLGTRSTHTQSLTSIHSIKVVD